MGLTPGQRIKTQRKNEVIEERPHNYYLLYLGHILGWPLFSAKMCYVIVID